MTCTILAVLALGAPIDEPKLDKHNAVFHDPIIAPYSELIMVHASIETQRNNHSLWLIDSGGKARQIGKTTVAPECLGVLPNDPIAIVADHSSPEERYKLVDLRTGDIAETLPAFDLTARRALTDQTNKNMLLVASEEDGALGLYTFAVNDWYRAKGDERDAIKPRKVWTLSSDPRDLVFSRDGSRVAMLDGDKTQILTIGREVTSRTLAFPGTVVHPRDFHPQLNVLLYESTAVMPRFGNTLGEVGVLDLNTGERRAAFYFAEETLPDKNPRFDSSGGFLFVDVLGTGLGESEGTLVNGHTVYKRRPVPAAFPIDLSRPQVSLLLFDLLIDGKRPHTMRPVFVTRNLDPGFLQVARSMGEVRSGMPFNIHSVMASAQSDKEMRAPSRRAGNIDFSMNWFATSAFSPTTPGSYVFVNTAAIVGSVGPLHEATSWNSGSIERFDASKPPAYFKRGDLVERGPQATEFHREKQGDIMLDTDVAVFNEPAKGYIWWVLHYPNWGHYGP